MWRDNSSIGNDAFFILRILSNKLPAIRGLVEKQGNPTTLSPTYRCQEAIPVTRIECEYLSMITPGDRFIEPEEGKFLLRVDLIFPYRSI
jgi:hypothetical protein